MSIKFEPTGVFSNEAARAEKRGTDEHVLFVEPFDDDGEHFEYTILHPDTCSIWIGNKPDPWSGSRIRYECAVAAEIDAVGFDSTFPDGLQPGWWLLSPWYHRTPSTPSGPEEHDAGIEVDRLGVVR